MMVTPKSLEQIGFRFQDHQSALWWLGLLYRRPKQFTKAVKTFRGDSRTKVGLVLFTHFIPYMTVFILIGRVFLFEILHFPKDHAVLGLSNMMLFHLQWLCIGLGITFALGICVDFLYWIGVALAVGLVLGLNGGIGAGVGICAKVGFTIGVGVGFSIGLSIGFTNMLKHEYGGLNLVFTLGLSVAIIASYCAEFDIPFNVAFYMGAGLIFTFLFFLFRLYYFFFHPLFLWPKVQSGWYRYHPVAWDDACSLPFSGLDLLLIAYTDYDQENGRKEIERLIYDYPSQRMIALRAKTILIAIEARMITDIANLNNIVTQLPEGEKGFLNETHGLRKMIGEIVQLQLQFATHNRPVLREPYAKLLCSEIENFRHRISGFNEPLRTEFRYAAEQWLVIAGRQLEEVQRVLAKEPALQVFRAGDPVDRNQEAFIPRNNVLGNMERQIMLSSGCPGIVLYGRRRMGKSTILKNLTGFLPPLVMPVVISMQNPQAFTSLDNFIGMLKTEIERILPIAPRQESVKSFDLGDLFDFLTAYNKYLESEGRRLLLSLDEYENIDEKLGQGVFPHDLLAVIRESIQSHRRISWIFSGSHDITELKHAPWTSYLVSIQTIEISLFSLAETRLLLTEPLKHSTLWPHNDPNRPSFLPEFWGIDGIEQLHLEAGGWPHLVQLIAATLIDLYNEEEANQINADLMEKALEKAIVTGHNVLYELMHRESFLHGEWEYLCGFKTRVRQSPPENAEIYTSLKRRLLVTEDSGAWRLRVPLMERWLKERG